ncbi:unnamed protein product [Scytosiphon promiscuus]
MESTPRFRVFDGRRNAFDVEEEAGRLPRRRMVTSVSVARQRRRNRRRPGAHRGLPLSLPRLLARCSGAGPSSRRRLLLLLLSACGTGAFVSARLLSWASSSSPSPGSTSPPPLRPRPDAVAGGADERGGGFEGAEGRRRQEDRGAAVSLGPDAIPSVVVVERRTAPTDADPARSGGARRASGLDDGGVPGGKSLEGRKEQEEEETHSHPHRCLNTLQGMTLIADSEGRVCRRAELDGIHRPGCCAAGPLLMRRETDAGGDGLGNEARFTGRRLPASSSTTATEKGGRGPAEEGRGGGGGRGGRLELVALSEEGTDGGAAPPAGHLTGGVPENDGFPPDQALSTPFSCWSCDVGGRGIAEGGDGGSPPSSCCRLYEFCVSCCQAPWRQQERDAIGAAAALSGHHPAYRELLGRVDSGPEGDGHDGAGRTGLLRAKAEAQRTGGEIAREREEQEDEKRRRAREEAFAHCAFRCRTYSGSVAHENSYRSPLKHCFGRFRPPAEAAPAAGGWSGGRLVPVEGGRAPSPLQLDPFLGGFKDARTLNRA